MVTVSLVTGPFGSPERIIEIDGDATVAEVISAHNLAFRLPTIAVMGGQPIMRADWPTQIVDEDLAFIGVPRGGGGEGGGKQIIGLVAALALSVAAPMIGGAAAAAFFGGSAIASSLIGGAVMPAGNLKLEFIL